MELANEPILNSVLLLVCCRQYSLVRYDDDVWATYRGCEAEIAFADTEVMMARDNGMLRMMGEDIVLGLSKLGKQTLSDVEKEAEVHFELIVFGCEQKPTIH